MIRAALEDLSAAGVAFATRGEQPIDDPPPGGDVDILVDCLQVPAADRVLRRAGFHHLEAPGHRGHRFYLGFEHERGRWLKVDVNIVPSRLGWDLSARDEEHLRRFAGYRIGTKANPGLLERTWSALARRRPAALRRLGPVVAVLGPDGAGKGSVIAALRPRIPATVTALYMGHGESSRLEYAGRARSSERGAELRRAVRAPVRSGLSLLPPAVHEAQYHVRQALLSSARVWWAYLYAWRGDIVVCDRHPLEDLIVDSPAKARIAALEGRLVRRLVPWPDAVVLLDAPGEVLFERKGDHSPAVLERWRRAYRDVFGGRGATVVSTTGELEHSVAEASAVVWAALRARRGW